MTELRSPIGDLLDDAPDDARLQSVREGISRRLRVPQDKSRRWTMFAGAGVLAAAAVALVLWMNGSVNRGPLFNRDGTVLSMLETGHDTELHASLADGSELALAADTVLTPKRNSGSEIVFGLPRGAVTFDVQPHTGRTWRIRTPLAEVTVIGTKFRVESGAGHVVVSVDRGVVLVTPHRNPEQAKLLTAGQSVRLGAASGVAPGASVGVTAPSASRRRAGEGALGPAHPEAVTGEALPLNPPVADEASLNAPVPGEASLNAPVAGEALPLNAPVAASADAPARPTGEPPHSPAHATSRRAGAWRAMAEQRDFSSAFAALGSDGLDREVRQASSVADLVTLADVARLSGHPSEAVAPLERVVREHARDPRSALAAFTLGRVRADSLHDPSGAARTFEQALGLGLPVALQEDALYRLFEAYGRSANRAAARTAATRYLQAHPSGRHAEAARQWAGAP